MTMLTGVPDTEAVRGRWKWFFGFGVAFVILGLLALFNAVDATLITSVILGVILLVAGVGQLIAAFASSGSATSRVLGAILGLLYLFVGANIVAEPLKGVVLLTVVIALWLMVGGVIRLVAAFAGPSGHKVLLFVVGIIELALGLWLLTGIPVSGVAIGFFIGLELLMAGFLWIVIGWAARSLPDGTPA
jgi:uncharacterized membrane protein HdeD (DUF308 family)